jgi:hypothetical protein
MKKVTLLLLTIALLSSCKQENKTKDYSEESLEVTARIYPDNMSEIFNAHGGIDLWNTFEGMYYEIEEPTINEKHTVALKSRKSIINAEHHILAFDGKDVWLKELDTVTFKSNPRFFYNLMFYFYAMPFILGDDGINYSDAEPLQMDGMEYPGISISYNAGIGDSPDDEYILYYNPETYKMEWLGYTVTYFSKEKSKEFHFIKYSDWGNVNGLVLPKTLTWYNYENNLPTTKRSDRNFVNASLWEESPNDSLFRMQDGAKIVE